MFEYRSKGMRWYLNLESDVVVRMDSRNDEVAS